MMKRATSLIFNNIIVFDCGFECNSKWQVLRAHPNKTVGLGRRFIHELQLKARVILAEAIKYSPHGVMS